jgi:hypothetical protein
MDTSGHLDISSNFVRARVFANWSGLGSSCASGSWFHVLILGYDPKDPRRSFFILNSFIWHVICLWTRLWMRNRMDMVPWLGTVQSATWQPLLLELFQNMASSTSLNVVLNAEHGNNKIRVPCNLQHDNLSNSNFFKKWLPAPRWTWFWILSTKIIKLRHRATCNMETSLITFLNSPLQH